MDPAPFFELHRGLPRQAPGSDALTARALGIVAGTGLLPSAPRILDAGCGPGRSALVLARETGGLVAAIDLHRPFLDELAARAAAEGLGDRIEPLAADMAAPPFPPGSFDLIWSEGAIYSVGFGAGLQAWRPLLKPSGLVAVTECVWLTDAPPAEALEFWDAAYPAMTSVEGSRRIAEDAGYRVIDAFTLPREAWWDEYYTPLEARIMELRRHHTKDAAWAEVLDDSQREIDLHRRHGDSYGYVFLILARS
ncbi:class I SAM-dependent methyltransferase [Skermanella mucosa]|uniref:SAM-dependent methyltransferase n=1 Tax=Skermanella mucosa TaxID=1789672 RepID=UPI00192C69EC|nr:class I SAM-dependent methyltransferase [Skermanella mucosa]UEM21085.1 class I SAM-dependent methyltransferase [Skermanella mucosa]